MRDIGILIWVALLLVGVVGSMASRVRSARRMQAPQGTQAPRPQPHPLPTTQWSLAPQPFVTRPAKPAAPPSKPPPRRPPAPAPSQVGHDSAQAASPTDRQAAAKRLFGDRRDLVRAVIAAEVLGKPRAFGDEYPRA